MASVYLGDQEHGRGSYYLSESDFFRHALILGKSGMGKSRLLENIGIQKIQNGEGLCFIDPHGSSARRLLEFVPEDRTRDVIYFNPADRANPLGINIYEYVDREQRGRVSDEIIRMFRHIYGSSWGPRLQYILYNTTAALLEHGRLSILAVEPMLTTLQFREWVLRKVHDRITRRFWTQQFNLYDRRLKIEATSSIHNKIGQFVANPWMRNMVGQVRSSIDFADVMNNKKILIANLSKGINGSETANLLGSMLVAKIAATAMARESYAYQAYVPFTLVVDEFQNVGTDTFAEIVKEARKYKLGLIAATQYLEQDDKEVKRAQKAMLGAAGTLMAFRVGSDDADTIASELDCQPRMLRELDPFRFRMRRGEDLIGNNIAAVADVGEHWQRSGDVIRQSRWEYGRQRHRVEGRINSFYDRLEGMLPG